MVWYAYKVPFSFLNPLFPSPPLLLAYFFVHFSPHFFPCMALYAHLRLCNRKFFAALSSKQCNAKRVCMFYIHTLLRFYFHRATTTDQPHIFLQKKLQHCNCFTDMALYRKCLMMLKNKLSRLSCYAATTTALDWIWNFGSVH